MFQNFINAVRMAEGATGAGSREVKKQAVLSLDENGRRLVYEALSPWRVFNIRKVTLPKQYADSDELSLPAFLSLLDRLQSRDLTGHAARDAITAALSRVTAETAEYLVRVLKKDLKWGLSGESVNEAILGEKRPKNPVVPVYACMLAEKYEAKKFKWKFPVILEAKYDGQRNEAFYNEGRLDHKARSGKDSSHLDGIFDEDFAILDEVLRDVMLGRFVLDGEVMGETWNDTLSAKGSKNQDLKDTLKLYAYDILSFDEWDAERCELTQLERSQLLDDAIDIARSRGMTRILKSKWRVVHNMHEAEAFYEECLNEGYEGVMIKDPSGKYEWKRSKNWVKWKPVQTFDGRITGIYAGDADKGMAHTLGGVNVEGVDENGVKFRCNVGSGFTHAQRDEIFANPGAYIGRMIEIEAYPDLHVDEDREYQALKWGVFKKFRDDKM